MRFFITSALNLLIWVLSLVLSGGTSWFLLNLSVLIGIVGYVYTWKQIRHILIGLGLGIVKFLAAFFIARGWWAFSYANLDMAAEKIDTFQALAPIFIGVSLIEAIIIYIIFKKIEEADA